MRFLILLFCLLTTTQAQIVETLSVNRHLHYAEDDWVSYGWAGEVTGVDLDSEVIYFSTKHAGILRYHFLENRWLFPFTTSNGLPQNRVYDVVYDAAKDQMLCKTRNGIYAYNYLNPYWVLSGDSWPPPRAPLGGWQPNSNNFPAYARPAFSELPTLFPPHRYSLFSNGSIIGPLGKKYFFTKRVVDPYQRIWLGTTGLGVAYASLNHLDLKFEHRSIPAIAPRTTYLDGQNLWVAGVSLSDVHNAIGVWNRKNDSWNYYKPADDPFLYFNAIYDIEGTKSWLFFATDQGLLAFNKKEHAFQNFKHLKTLKTSKINDLHILGNQLFMATDWGLYSLNLSTFKARSIARRSILNTTITKLTATKKDLYIAAHSGVFRYNSKEDSVYNTDITPAFNMGFTHSISFKNDSLWFANGEGFAVYNTQQKKTKSFLRFNLSFYGKVHDIAQTFESVWFATDEGLLKYNSWANRWYLYTTEDGLLSNKVYHISVAGDYLWLSTDLGITRFRWYSEEREE